jgi:hypothetical protein
MLHLIKSAADSFIDFINQDPVRPHIPKTQRVGENRDIFVSRADSVTARAITCVSYQHCIPEDEEHLFETTTEPEVAIFYTIWSYAPGAGKDLIFEARDWIKENRPEIKRFVTLSPPTEMARRFHIKNGAIVLRENKSTVNYEYL